MPYKVYKFVDLYSDLEISEDHPDWNEAYNNWLEGKDPTSEKWKYVIAKTKEKNEKVSREKV